MKDLLRPYTNEELDLLFNETGFPEISRQFVKEEFEKEFNIVLTRELSHLDRTSLENAKKDLQETLDTDFDTLREHIWHFLTPLLNVSEYVKQRELGHGHEWAKLFCHNLENYKYGVNNTMSIYITYTSLKEARKEENCIFDRQGGIICLKRDNLSCQELKIAVKNIAKGEGEIVERFIGYMISSLKEGTIDELFQEALDFKNFYDRIVADGHLPEDAWHYALDLWDEEVDSTFSIAYREAMKHHSRPLNAWGFANFCSETDIKQHWAFIGERELGDFPETWQREIIANFKIKDAGKGWPNYVNEIRKSLGLETK